MKTSRRFIKAIMCDSDVTKPHYSFVGGVWCMYNYSYIKGRKIFPYYRFLDKLNYNYYNT